MFTKFAQQVILDSPNIIERGLSIPARYLTKLILWDSDVSVGSVDQMDEQTIDTVQDLAKKTPEVKYYVGHTPYFDQLKRQATMKGSTHSLYNVLTLPVNALTLPFTKLMGGDYYNPAANTVIVRSNVPAIAAHEAGHAKDFNKVKFPTLQALAYSAFPIFKPYPEYKASMYAGNYAKKNNINTEVLAPAFGSYAGSALGQPILGLLGGHLLKDEDSFHNTKKKYEM